VLVGGGRWFAAAAHLQVDLQVGDEVRHVLPQLQQPHHAAAGPPGVGRHVAVRLQPPAAAAQHLAQVLPGLLQMELDALQAQQQLEEGVVPSRGRA
jgi:hypothetical protein